MPTGLQFVSVVALCSLSGYVSTAATHPSVNPNQDFSNRTLQLHSPDSSGWHGYVQTPTVIAFAKTGSIPDETFVAQVNLFHLPPSQIPRHSPNLCGRPSVKGSPTERFETLGSECSVLADRGYPCVTYHAASNDKSTAFHLFQKSARFEVFALYCQHPIKPGLGFAAVYLHRGGTADENIDKEARPLSTPSR